MTPLIRPDRKEGESPMTHLPANQDTPRSIKSAFRDSYDAKSAADRLRTAATGSNLFIIIAFCAIGLLVTLNLIFRFPDLGVGVEQLVP
jgi:hypothetical protein